MSDNQNFSDIFTPVQSDFGLSLLSRVLGCTVDAIWNGGQCQNGDLISTIASIFNVGVAVVAAVLVTYNLYKMTFDTARDGHAGGEGSSTSYSVVKVGAGMVLLLPVAGGFTIAQVIVIQLLVWGSGFGDTLWNKASAAIQAGAYTQTAVPKVEVDPEQRGQFALALYARTAGWLCAYGLADLGKTFGASGGTVTSTNLSSDGGWFSSAQVRGLGFKGGPWFDNSDALCGSISYRMAAPLEVSGPDAAMYNKLDSLAENSVQKGMNAAFAQIDAHAAAIARGMMNSEPNVETLKKQIDDGVKAAALGFQAGIATGLNSADLKTLAQDVLKSSTDAGWVMAPAWQRAMVNSHSKLQTLARGATIEFAFPEDLSSYVMNSTRGLDSAMRTITEKYRAEENRLRNIAGFVADYSKTNPSGAAGATPQADASAGVVARAFRAILSQIKIEGSEGRFVDPFASLAGTGSALAYAAGGTAISGAVLDWLPATRAASAVTGAGAFASGLASTLIFAGFIVGGLLPLVPLAYFFAAVLGWLIAAVEAVLALPVAVLNFFVPRQGVSAFTGFEGALSLALGLLIRPALIVSGLIISLLVASAGILLLNAFSESIFAIMIPLDGGPTTSGLLGAGAIAFYVISAAIIVLYSSSLISELPDTVLRFVGGQVDARSGAIGGALAGAIAAPALLSRTAGRAFAGLGRGGLRAPKAGGGK
ncbi:DotA/TraY family protein [Castellaniella sp.]|uniref:DotA/TraY family protein n=1 Tax=Castellaniella sp. TaxID=1955812 RepID=UPI002AFE4DAF|nr:DotA/TraY family protein [Castellaniella sp.]